MRRPHYPHILLLPVFFLLTWSCFFVNGSWYEPAVVQIKGEVSGLPTGFDVSWDSGSGYNNYQKYKVRLQTKAKKGEDTHRISIAYLDRKNSASLSSEIICRPIVVDGKTRPFIQGAVQNGEIVPGGGLRLAEEGATADIEVPAREHIAIELLTNNHAGIVTIAVDDFAMERDLYMANVEAKSRTFDFWIVDADNRFTVKIDLPRYKIENLKIQPRDDNQTIALTSVSLQTEQGKEISLQQEAVDHAAAVFTGISNHQRKYFSWNQFFLQAFFAFITTWLFSALYRLSLKCGGAGALFSGKRAVFWGLLLGAVSSYLIWLLIFWPGVLSVDSLKIWRAAQLPGVWLNDHPILNVFLYTYLYHLWNNPAVVPLFHIFAMSTLVAVVFYTIYRHRVGLKLLFPFYLFTVLSIPIGLYNTVLWKDIPFALLVVFWAFISACLFLKKQSGSLHLSGEQIMALLLLLLSLGLIRHNGLIYLVFIPVLYLFLGIIRIRKELWIGLGVVVLLGGAVLLAMKNSVVTDSGYLLVQAKMYLNNIFNSSVQEILARTWRNYWGILDINQTASKWDLFHFFLEDRYSYSFLQHAGWHDVYPYLEKGGGLLGFLKDNAMRVYWASYQTPIVYLSWNPVWALFLFPACVLAFRWLPLSAIFSVVILAQIFTLVTLLNVLNWRYYYFACLAGYFIIPMICLDISRIRSRKYHEI